MATTWNIFYNSDKEIVWSTTGNVDTNIINNEKSKGNTHIALDLDKDPNSDMHMVNSGADGLDEKTIFNATFSSLSPALDEVVNVTGLPSGTEVFIDGTSKGTMSNTTLTLTIKEAGTYKVKFSKAGYRPHSPVSIIVKRYGE